MDTFNVFEGWQRAHTPKKAGKHAPSLEEAQDLALRYG